MPKTHQIVTGILQSMRAAAFALFIAGAANAQQHSESQPELGCTAADFQGTHEYSGSGTIVEGPTAGPVAFVGQLTSDGSIAHTRPHTP